MASFETFKPIFGESVPECPGSDILRRCLFHVYASDSYHLTVHVTDFISGSWETLLSVSKLDDMRDAVGVGGSWSEFVEYMVASLKSDNVKLLLEGDKTARLVSQKAKGMPRIVISLKKIMGSSADEAMANLSLELYKAFKSLQHEQVVPSEKVNPSAALLDDKEMKNATHSQLDRSLSDKVDALAPTRNGQDSPAKQAAQEVNSTKPVKRVPAHRRTRKRGALLQDSDEEDS